MLQLLADSLDAFMAVFSIADRIHSKPLHEAILSFECGQCTPINLTPGIPRFFFPVLASHIQEVMPPLESKEGTIRVAKVVSPLLSFLMDQKLPPIDRIASINVQLAKVYFIYILYS